MRKLKSQAPCTSNKEERKEDIVTRSVEWTFQYFWILKIVICKQTRDRGKDR